MLFLASPLADALHGSLNVRTQGLGHLFGSVPFEACEVELACGHLLGDGLRVEACGDDGVGNEIEYSSSEETVLLDVVDKHIRQGHCVVVDAVDA